MSMYSPSGSGNTHIDEAVGYTMPYEVRMTGDRHCVYKIGTDKSLGCHDTHEKALAQVKALYAQEGGKMSEALSYLISLDSINLGESENSKWVHALPFGKYKHPKYGEIDVSLERAQRLADNVKNKVREIEPSINYNHNNESVDGATGWVKGAQVRSDGLWLFVEFVQDAADKIRQKKFKYFSLEFLNEWINSQGAKFQDVVVGGALTNRPFMKNLVPINLSESVIENAFDLVSGITGKTAIELKEDKMDDATVQKIIDGLHEKMKSSAPQPPPPVKTEVAKLEEIEDLKKLAESNPIVGTLLKHFETQALSLQEQAKIMREVTVDSKLAEFDNSKLMLSEPAKQKAREIMLELSDDLTKKFWEFMEMVRNSQSFLVELGERSGAAVRRGFSISDKTATQEFMERTNTLVLSDKLSFVDAMSRVASEDPELYNRYRLGDGAPTDASKLSLNGSK